MKTTLNLKLFPSFTVRKEESGAALSCPFQSRRASSSFTSSRRASSSFTFGMSNIYIFSHPIVYETNVCISIRVLFYGYDSTIYVSFLNRFDGIDAYDLTLSPCGNDDRHYDLYHNNVVHRSNSLVDWILLDYLRLHCVCSG